MNQQSNTDAADPGLFAGLHGLKACVDIGGTKVAVSVADARGLHARVVEPTVKQGPSDALGAQVLRMIADSCAGAGMADQRRG